MYASARYKQVREHQVPPGDVDFAEVKFKPTRSKNTVFFVSHTVQKSAELAGDLT